MANGQQLRLKVLSNNLFFLLLLDEKKKQDRHFIIKIKRAKVVAVFSDEVFIIIWSHRSNFCFPKSSIIYKDNYIEKDRDNLNISIIDIEKEGKIVNSNMINRNRANDPDVGIINANKDKRANHFVIANIDRM